MARDLALGRNVLGHEPEPVPPQDPEAAALFDAIRLRASGMVQRESHSVWWRGARGWCFEDDGSLLVIAVPSPQFVAWYRALYMGTLATCAREVGREGLRFRFVVIDPDEGPKVHDGSVR